MDERRQRLTEILAGGRDLARAIRYAIRCAISRVAKQIT